MAYSPTDLLTPEQKAQQSAMQVAAGAPAAVDPNLKAEAFVPKPTQAPIAPVQKTETTPSPTLYGSNGLFRPASETLQTLSQKGSDEENLRAYNAYQGGANPTVGQIYSSATGSNELDAAYDAQGRAIKATQEPINEEQIRERTMQRFQAEIDAVNRFYAEKTARQQGAESILGQGRLGSGAAIQARRGMIGSDFGDAQTDRVNNFNNQQLQGIADLNAAEANARIESILGQARGEAQQEIANKQAAMAKGRQEYIDFLNGQKERLEKRADNSVAALVASETEASDAELEQIAKELGIDVKALKEKYVIARKLEQEKNLKEDKFETVAAGSSIYKNGVLVGTAPNKPADGKPIIEKFADNSTRQWNEKDQSWDILATGSASDNLSGAPAEYEYYKKQEIAEGRTPVSFNEYQTMDANRKARAEAITAGGLNSAQQSAAFKLADDYEKASGSLPKVISHYNSVSAAANDPTPAGDLSLIFGYMKMLDPNSVVREGEFATAQNAASIPTRIQNAWNKTLSGERLNPTQRQDFVNQAKKLYQSALDQQKQVDQTYTERSAQFGVPSNLVVRSQNSYLDTPTTSQPVTINQIESSIGQSLTQALRQKAEDYLNDAPDLSIEEIKGLLGFNQPLSTGTKGSTDVSGIKDFSRVDTSMGTGVATGIQGGSSLWKYGLDLVIDGGKGAPVKTPFGGTVVFAGKDGGFGNSVKIKMDNGEVIRLSHLDSINVKTGQRVPPGQTVGPQGNSGKTLGPTGVHVDVTMYKPDGKPYSSREVASFLNTKSLKA